MEKEKLGPGLDRIQNLDKIEKIDRAIPDSTIGTKRKAEFVKVNCIDFEGKFADLTIRIFNLDADGNLIQNPDIRATRDIQISISNTDRVIDGVLVEPEDPRYEDAIPEFDWWMKAASQIPFLTLLDEAINLLAQTGRFDRV